MSRREPSLLPVYVLAANICALVAVAAGVLTVWRWVR